MHGPDAKRDRLVFGERAALLHAAQRLAAQRDLRERLDQLTVALLRDGALEVA
jgi:predicted transposase YdaD